MVELELSSAVPASVSRCWASLVDLDQTVQASTAIDRIEVRSSDGNQRTTAWQVILRGSLLEWTQVEMLDPVNHVIEFEMTEGQPKYVGGRWFATPDPGDSGAVLGVEFEFDFGLPGASAGIDRAMKILITDLMAERVRALQGEW